MMISFAMANQTRHYMTFTTLHYEVHYVCHKYQDGMDCELVKSLFCVTVTLSSLHSNHLIALPAHLHHEALPSDAIRLVLKHLAHQQSNSWKWGRKILEIAQDHPKFECGIHFEEVPSNGFLRAGCKACSAHLHLILTRFEGQEQVGCGNILWITSYRG